LRVAVRQQHSHVVKILLQKIVDIDRILSLDAESSTLLHIAVLNGDDETVKLLLEAHSSVTAEDGANCTALHLAARSGSVAVVNLLLDAKSDITRSNGEQKTALHIASEYGHGEIVSLLLAALCPGSLEANSTSSCSPRGDENGRRWSFLAQQ